MIKSACLALCMGFLTIGLGGCAGPDTKKFLAEQAPAGDPTVIEHVKQAFADQPVMIAIAMCESGMRQYEKDGKPLRGRVHRPDMGVFQINTRAHAPTLRTLGYNVAHTEDNVAFARKLFSEQGTRPWASSRHCWRKKMRDPKIMVAHN